MSGTLVEDEIKNYQTQQNCFVNILIRNIYSASPLQHFLKRNIYSASPLKRLLKRNINSASSLQILHQCFGPDDIHVLFNWSKNSTSKMYVSCFQLSASLMFSSSPFGISA